MARAHYVKKARKDNPVVSAGEPYWWWKFMEGGRGGRKRFSKNKPRQSQLTQSEFFGALYAMQENVEDFNTATVDLSELETFRDEIAGEAQSILDGCQERLDNTPDGLRDGSVNEGRVSSMEEVVSNIEGVDCDEDDWEEEAKDELDDDADEDEISELAEEKMHERLSEKYDELVAAVEYDGE